MDIYQPNSPRGKARERSEARKRRREPMVKPLNPANSATPAEATVRSAAVNAETRPANTSDSSAPTAKVQRVRETSSAITARAAMSAGARRAAQSGAHKAADAARALQKVDLRQGGTKAAWMLRDGLWHLRRNPIILVALTGALALLFVLYIAVHVFTGRIFPNVYTVGINLGGMTADEAAAALQQYWATDLTLDLVDGERVWTVTPAEIGLRLDARKTVESMQSVGLSGVPFGYNVYPSMELDLLTSQNRLLDISEDAQIQPYNAGYRWEGDLLVGVEGTDGRFLDVSGTLDMLYENLPVVVDAGRMELIMTMVAPEVVDPEPYLDQVRALSAQQFQLTAYDPFTNERFTWSTDRTTFVSWLEAGEDSLDLREETFAPFIDAQLEGLQREDPLRYLEPTETMNNVRDAIRAGVTDVNMRVRYQGRAYEIESGDTGYYIARRTGLPFYLIQEANPGRDWEEMLSPGEVINLPSRDATIPLEPVPSKRIVVNIDTQYLVAFENEQVVFDWAISTGLDYAPTSPGVYQILSHVDLATGSSFELCSADTCGTWDMYWFMGIYEVTPGLVNGFHGAVVLPNGAYLGGGNVGQPFTYGCVMSRNDEAERLYRWADEGTLVEIISYAYDPQSDLGRAVEDGSWSTLPRGIPSSELAGADSVWNLSNLGL